MEAEAVKNPDRKAQMAAGREVPLLTWGIPRKLKLRFKDACIRRGMTMRQALIQLMEDFCPRA